MRVHMRARGLVMLTCECPSRQLDWRPEKQGDTRKRHEKVVIIRNMFHPSDFEVRAHTHTHPARMYTNARERWRQCESVHTKLCRHADGFIAYKDK